jgi:phage repressor protein C with HTH and peptisase S24 domain
MPNRIKEWRTRFGLSYAALAQLVGTTAPQIQKLERGERRLTVDWMLRIAAALSSLGQGEVHPKDLLPPEGDGPTREQDDYADRGMTVNPAARLVDMVPVHGAARGGADQEMFIDTPIDFKPRPLVLRNVTDGYAMQVTGSSMQPRYWDGQIVYVHPRRRPRPGSGVIIVKPSNAVLIKEFVRWLPNENGLRVKEYQPEEREFEIKGAEVRHVHTIVGSEEPF